MNGPTPEAETRMTEVSVVPEHLLQDGEVVIFAIKPSGWYVLLTSAAMLVALLLVAVGVHYLDMAFQIPLGRQTIHVFCLVVAIVRLVLACMQWMGILYVLTNRRVLMVKALLRVRIHGCMLKEISETSLTYGAGERLFGVGTLLFKAETGGMAENPWQSLSRPVEVQNEINKAIHRARK